MGRGALEECLREDLETPGLAENPERPVHQKPDPLTNGLDMGAQNRISNGLGDASWGAEVPGGATGSFLFACDFPPLVLHRFGDYIRMGEKKEPRNKPPNAMNRTVLDIRPKIKIDGSVYGEEHISERTKALSLRGDLHVSYESPPPQFPMAAWGCSDV